MSLENILKNNNDYEILKYKDGTNIGKIIKISDVIIKVIEIDKSSIAKSGVVFLEPIAMEYAHRKGVPAPIVTSINRDEEPFFSTKYIDGINGEELIVRYPSLRDRAIYLSNKLQEAYYQIGIERQMDLKDLIFEIEDGTIIGVIPLDFERIKYNGNLDWSVIYEIANEWQIELPEGYLNNNNKHL